MEPRGTGQGTHTGRVCPALDSRPTGCYLCPCRSQLNQAVGTKYSMYSRIINYQYYEEKTITVTKIILGMEIEIPSHTIRNDIDTPNDEKFQQISSKNN